jgi:predicted N-acetyltransferase YhbS
LSYHEINKNGDFIYGPFAISPICQKQGLGAKLRIHVENIARKKEF